MTRLPTRPITTRHRAPRRRRIAWLATLPLFVAGCTAGDPNSGTSSSDTSTISAASTTTTGPLPDASATDVLVQLFEWTWPAIARDCTDTLGPAGYAYVQTSPPQEHIVGQQWWTQYQPVSYKVESRLGTRDEFAAMVQTCHAAGVKVVADVVLNHMSGQDNAATGFAGSAFSHFDYPGIYTKADFHHCGRNINDDIQNYQDAFEVQNCELLNLADLDTGSAHVRTTEQGYLNDLLSLGVDGFRVDAAKHMSPEDLAAIVGGLPDTTLIVQEVIRGGGEPITPEQYASIGQVQEFGFAREVSSFFRTGQVAALASFAPAGKYLDSAVARTFVDNHDTERNGETLNEAAGAAYRLANVYLLATDYGQPAVYSGYSFTDRDAGPPQDASGNVDDATCGTAPWTCFHHEPAVLGMVGFHNAVAGTPLTATADGSVLRMARGAEGVVVINTGGATFTGTEPSSLPAGSYCDVIHGALANGVCSGPTVTVAADGSFSATVAANDALALHVGARVG